MAKYRLGFRNGMVVTIEADQFIAVAHNDMRFLMADGKQADQSRFIRAYEVLFVSPAEDAHVERPAVAVFSVDSK